MSVREIMCGMVVTWISVCEVCAGGEPQPILHYTFDGPRFPLANLGSLGPTYGAVLYGDAVLTPAKAPMAVEFFASGDWVIPGGDDALDLEDALDIADADFSLYARLTVTILNRNLNAGRFIVTKEHTGNDPGYVFAVRNESGKAQIGITNGAAGVHVLSLASIDDGDVHELIGMRLDDVLYLYVDGCLVNWAAIPEDFTASTANDERLIIGGRTINQDDPNPNGTAGNNDDFGGILDEVAVYTTGIVTPCIADISCDGVVDSIDLLALLGEWGSCEQCRADLSRDDVVDSIDLLGLLGAWGGCP